MRTNPRILAPAMALVLAACGRSGSAAAGGGASAAAHEPQYSLSGEVMAVDAAHHTIRVRHDAVKNLMPAMTMDFAVAAGDAALVTPGERIRATLIPSATGDWRLEAIYPDDHAADAEVAAAARRLREDTTARGRSVYREVGEDVPDFALYDQSGHVVSLARFRGKQIMLNFIYTRCPVATMCPAATLKMMETQKLARAAGVTNLELVSITLDPEHDTPGVLKEYAAARAIDTRNFSFLTGPEPAIKDLLTQFGIIAEFDGDLIKHTLATLLVDESGRIIWRADGSLWEPKDFVAKMHRSAAPPVVVTR